MNAYMTYSGELSDYRWSGGAYIEVGYVISDAEHFVGGNWTAFHAINVWDYELDQPQIKVTLEAFQARCDLYEEDETLGYKEPVGVLVVDKDHPDYPAHSPYCFCEQCEEPS